MSLILRYTVERRFGRDLRKGRNGMNMWTLFVLAQARLCLNISYDDLMELANNHYTLRHLIGFEKGPLYPRKEFEFQNV